MKTNTILVALFIGTFPPICTTVLGKEEAKTEEKDWGVAVGYPKRIISVEIDGVRYRGECDPLGVPDKKAGTTSLSYSPLVLVPDVEGKVTPSILYRPTVIADSSACSKVAGVHIQDEVYLVPFQRLCMTDKTGTRLTVFSGKLPIEAYKTDEELKKAIRALLSGSD